jgi:hypothetical protein
MIRSTICAAAVATAFAFTAPAQAAPGSANPELNGNAPATVQLAQYWHHHDHWRHRWYPHHRHCWTVRYGRHWVRRCHW